KDKSDAPVQYTVVFLFGAWIDRGIGRRDRLGVAFYIVKDRVDLLVVKTGKNIHRRPAVLIEQVVEIDIARRQYLGIVVDPRVEQVPIGDALGNSFQCRTYDDADRVMALGAIRFKEGFAIQLLRGCSGFARRLADRSL